MLGCRRCPDHDVRRRHDGPVGSGEHAEGEDLAQHPQVRTMVEGYVSAANKRLERWETVKKFEILPSELSVDEGEVTPSLKIRRRAVEEKHAEVLAGMYERD